MLKCFYVFWWMILLDRFAKHHPKNRLSLIVVKQSFIANPAKSPSSWWNYSQCHDPPGFRVANILLSRWPTCKLLGITYLANKKSSIFFLSLAHMVHGLSEISTVIRLNQAWFNLSHLNHLWFGFRMVLFSRCSQVPQKTNYEVMMNLMIQNWSSQSQGFLRGQVPEKINSPCWL